jgi:hypothetical protein
MIEQDPQPDPAANKPDDEPRRDRLSRILAERPEARPRLRRAIGSLLGVVLVFIGVLGVLLIWHIRRRAQLIRDRLGPPRNVTLPDLSKYLKRSPGPPEASRD